MNLYQTAKKLQTALSMRGRFIRMNQYQNWSEKAQRMVTKYVLCERVTDPETDKQQTVTLLESYSLVDVVMLLADLLAETGGDSG